MYSYTFVRYTYLRGQRGFRGYDYIICMCVYIYVIWVIILSVFLFLFFVRPVVRCMFLLVLKKKRNDISTRVRELSRPFLVCRSPSDYYIYCRRRLRGMDENRRLEEKERGLGQRKNVNDDDDRRGKKESKRARVRDLCDFAGLNACLR